MKRTLMPIGCLLLGFLISLAVSWGLALLGEPQSVWLFRDILGVLK